ncbi:MAG TPA: dihydrolipoyl dehydrogenase [Flavobacteriales bacterium]|nr:dihydrolipoyl dehydrogenase [Flavobacteriales bacterium]
MIYDLLIIGSGPGGYVAAIRGAQLGMKVAIIERSELGGVCLNWGCIPTKALLKSAQVFNYLKHAEDYGIKTSGAEADLKAIVKRSRDTADGMSKGVQFLLKKNKIDVIQGSGKILADKKVEVTGKDSTNKIVEAKSIIIATGARSRKLPNLEIDGKSIIGYREALILSKIPDSMVIVGSGAIGSEFAYFYQSLGTKVTLVEFMPTILPIEDEEVSQQLTKSFKKMGMKVMTGSSVESVATNGDKCKVSIKTAKGTESIEADIVLSAVGITANIENLGLEGLGVKTNKGKIVTDEFYQTKVSGIYAIGDCVGGPALAHVASAEGIICVEKIAGEAPTPLDYGNIPGCTYCQPEVASVGLTEKAAKDQGLDIKIGKFPFSASGKANAAGHKEGFVKLIFDGKYGELLGGHMIGYNVTEMISEIVALRKLETTGPDLIKTIHPHPTMSEAIMEAAAAAYDEVIHL